jgi:cell division protein FtsW
MRRETTALLLSILALTLVGVLMVFSASSVDYAVTPGRNMFLHFTWQGAYAGLGLFALFVCARTDYHILRKPLIYNTLVIGALALVALVLIPGVGIERNGARRWLSVGFASFQPSEAAKLAVILLLAVKLSSSQDHVKSFFRGFLPPLLIAGLFVGVILPEPDLGAPIVICAATFAMMAASGVRWAYILGSGSMVAAGLVVLVLITPYRVMRLLSFLDPWANSQEGGFQLIQSMAGFARGGVWGLGPGASEQKLFYLPEAENDFIFAILAEEMGLVGTLTVLGLFMVFLVLALRIAAHARDVFGCLLAVGIGGMIAFQAAFNMAVTIGLLPTKGLPLPFISAGGTALIITMAACGILINVGLQAIEPKKAPLLIPSRPIG